MVLTKSKRAKGASAEDEEVPKSTSNTEEQTKKDEVKGEEEDIKPKEVSSEEEAGPSAVVKEEYTSLCRDLSMDGATEAAAWDAFLAIRRNYTLEGNQLHWLACALYVACHNSQSKVKVEGSNITTASASANAGELGDYNCVSLTRLLRSCKLSLIQFFNKAKKWSDMANLNSPFRDKIDSLERNFAVSNVIFKKYQPIFVFLFKDPAKDPPKLNRSRKQQKKPPCTPGEVFDFCWGLFVRVKTDFPAISDDLVNSYHLLLSCVDYIYANAFMSDRSDLLNENFDSGFDKDKLTDLDEPPCILDRLCHIHDGIISEVRSIRQHWWKPHIKKFFDQKILRGESGNLCGILDPLHFETNAKNIRKDYESYVLSIGEYDESVFLGEDANEEIGTPTKLAGNSNSSSSSAGDDFQNVMKARHNLATQFDATLIPNTPLSGKHYLRAKEQLKVTPVSTATYLVSRLNGLLGRREAEPSEKLRSLFAEVGERDPSEAIAKRVAEMGDTFCQHYTASSDKHPSFARMRLKMGVILYHKLLEGILFAEQRKGKPLGNLLEQDHFHRALFTCCLEIVIFSYNSQRTFPWILDTFGLEPIHFYKVIEVIIRTEESLARDVVKHLQRIEEQILESRAWTSSSPLWAAIERDPEGVPSCEEVSLPGGATAQDRGGAFIDPIHPGQSPLSHHKRHFNIKSPMATDRFKSPVVSNLARKQLTFGDAPNQITPTSPLRAGHGILSPQKTIVKVQGKDLSISEVQTMASEGKIILDDDARAAIDAAAASENAAVTVTKRTGSLALFFRKVYHLAHLRLDLLCHTLQIFDEDVKRKIWTTFEYTLVTHTDLMKDRHLDQLLMCSLYIVCKVVGQNKNFTDIIKNYRSQPQAASHVYRSVLLRSKASKENAGEDGAAAGNKEEVEKTGQAPPTPGRLAASSSIVDGEERGDLIKFYNSVFMARLQNFSLKFKRSRQSEAPPLSPLPKLRAHPQSPCRKVSESHSVFIRPLKAAAGERQITVNPLSPHKPLSYSFSRSPAKDLARINALMQTEARNAKPPVGKRLLADDPAEGQGQVILVQGADGAPPVKMQLLNNGGIVAAGGGTVNNKLELILNDRGQD